MSTFKSVRVRALKGALCLSSALSFSQPVLAEGVNDEALMASKPAAVISAYGLFSDVATLTPDPALTPYNLNTPLFTDYALKSRFVYVPDGQSATFKENESFDFPVGSVLVKTFAMPADLRSPEEDVKVIETRLLIHQESGWVALPYIWNEDMSDAKLKVAGRRIPMTVTGQDGTPLEVSYAVPNKNQCKGCHAIGDEVIPIGPKARYLNGDYAYEGGSENQLAHWSEAGILTGLPELTTVAKAAKWDDPEQDLDARARAYLDINCAHCHREGGPADNSGLFLDTLESNPTTLGVWKSPVSAGVGTGGFDFSIYPGRPDESIMISRMISNDPAAMMPELGRSLVHIEGVQLVREWIAAMEE